MLITKSWVPRDKWASDKRWFITTQEYAQGNCLMETNLIADIMTIQRWGSSLRDIWVILADTINTLL